MLLDIAPSEFLVIAGAAVIFIGPKDMPRALRTAGKWFAQMRRVSNHFRAGVDNLIREAELAEMEKEWRERNAAIMAAHPPAGAIPEGETMGVPALTHAAAPGEAAGAGIGAAGPGEDWRVHDPLAHDPLATPAYGDHDMAAGSGAAAIPGGHKDIVPGADGGIVPRADGGIPPRADGGIAPRSDGGIAPRGPAPHAVPPGGFVADAPGVAAPFAAMSSAAMRGATVPDSPVPAAHGDAGEPELPLSTPRQPLP